MGRGRVVAIFFWLKKRSVCTPYMWSNLCGLRTLRNAWSEIFLALIWVYISKTFASMRQRRKGEDVLSVARLREFILGVTFVRWLCRCTRNYSGLFYAVKNRSGEPLFNLFWKAFRGAGVEQPFRWAPCDEEWLLERCNGYSGETCTACFFLKDNSKALIIVEWIDNLPKENCLCCWCFSVRIWFNMRAPLVFSFLGFSFWNANLSTSF